MCISQDKFNDYFTFQALIISVKYIILILVDGEDTYEHFTNCGITKRKKA